MAATKAICMRSVPQNLTRILVSLTVYTSGVTKYGVSGAARLMVSYGTFTAIKTRIITLRVMVPLKTLHCFTKTFQIVLRI